MTHTKQSFWDWAVVKKYSSLSHYRILSQLATELKAYPMQRKHNQRKEQANLLKDKSTGNKAQIQTKKVLDHEVIPSKTTLYNNLSNEKDIGGQSTEDYKRDNNDSFIDRLNKIQMK